MKNILPVIFFIVLGLSVIAVSAENNFQIIAKASTVKKFSIWEWDFIASGLKKINHEQALFDAVVVNPLGEKIIVPAFLNNENFKSFWRIRFCPRIIGDYQVQLFFRKNGEKTFIAKTSFACLPSKSKGFLQRNQVSPNYLKFSNGEGFFAIGFNVCWSDSANKLNDYLRYLDLLEKNGCSYTRLWLCSWGFNLETEKPYIYNYKAAMMLDTILKKAKEKNIYIKLCLLNFHDFISNSNKGPYLSKSGPCKNGADFFKKEEAKNIFKAFLRYVVARYGAHTSLYGWELWNEILYTNSNLSQQGMSNEKAIKTLFVPWTIEMAKTLRSLDSYKHLITTSIGLNESWAEIWKIPEIDIVQYHSYLNHPQNKSLLAEDDIPNLFIKIKKKLDFYKKPFLISEFGYAGTNDDNLFNDLDKGGIALHSSIWAAAFSGYSGTAMHWWWDNYIDKNQLYYHFAALSGFFKNFNWDDNLIFFTNNKDKYLQIMGIKGNENIYLWLSNKRSNWFTILKQKQPIEPIEGYAFTLKGDNSSTYTIEWFDTKKIKLLLPKY